MTRIAFVIPTLDQSGAERQLTLLATGLPQNEFQIRVFALNRGGPLMEPLRQSGIETEVMGKRWRFDPLTWLRLRTSLKRFAPQIVQSFLFSANSLVRLPGVVPDGCRVIVSERCVDSWKSPWQLWMDRALASRTTAMTANSESVAQFYQSAGIPPHLVTVIPNAMPVQPSQYSREQSRQILGLQPHHKVVGFSGRLAPQKRLKDLIWAFQLLHQTIDDVRLVLLGDGPDRDELAEMARSLGCRDRILFAGHRTDAFSLMSALDVFVLASEFEGMSNSLMEAMSLAIPCVVSDIAPNRELISDRETGLVFPLGQGSLLTKALCEMMQNEAFSKQLGEAGRRKIVDEHSVELLVRRHRDLYQSLLNRPDRT